MSMTETMFVTGAARGIGAAIAKAAAAKGYRVGVFDLDGEAAAETAASLPDAVALQGSVTEAADIEGALDDFGAPPDAFVSNAGIVRFGPLAELSEDDWRSVIEVNLTGTFLATRAAARRMIDNGGGSIVNITSINGIAPGPNSGAYAAAKAGAAMMTQQMSIEWGPAGVRVNSVAPGLIDGGMSAPIFADEEFRELRVAKIPLRRLGLCEDVANAVMFLASPESSYVTGHQIVVDGGVVNSIIGNLPRPASIDGVGAD
jgi:NAD(P)-dependent dehydrogenase (short-subunit alcohol dehydrogenase family)